MSSKERQRVVRQCLLAIASALHGKRMGKQTKERSEQWLAAARIDIWTDEDGCGREATTIALDRFVFLMLMHQTGSMRFRAFRDHSGQHRLEIERACKLNERVYNIELVLSSFD
jgi:hypothetical protein